MAHMIPDTAPRFGPGQRAERALFDALANRLDDGFFVYYRLRYHVAERAGEGEIDFLIVHREYGMLVVECKGLGVRRDGEGRWWRLVEEGREESLKKTPWAQAQGQAHDLARLLQERVAATFPGRNELPLAYGHAVAFPLSRVGDAALPLEVDRKLLIDAGDLATIDRRIMAILAHWQKNRARKPFVEHEFKRFRKSILHPLLRIVPTLGGRMAADEETFVRLSQRQCEMLGMVLGNPRLRVTGGAGTGKTVLAFETARRLAGKGAAVLFLCYNRPLADLAAGVLDSGGARVHANNFHRLCAQAATALGRNFSPPSPDDRDASRRFWEVEAPGVLLEAVADSRMPRYDAIVVDEGQDFAREWWELIEGLLREPKTGQLVVFEDPAQEIFGRPGAIPAGMCTVSLVHNFRNTRRITEVVRSLGCAEMQAHPECPEGEPPSVLPLAGASRNQERLAELTAGLVQKQVPIESIVILTPHSRKNSSLAGLERLGDFELADDPSAREGKLLHTTIGKFKGLESDVVILCDVDPSDPRCNRNARYVAASRARHALYVLARGDWMA